MDLRDALTLHQLTLASEGRTAATQRQYMHFERTFLRYLDASGIPATLEALNPTNVRQALEWYRAQDNPQRRRNGEVAAKTFIDTLRLWANFLEREGVFEHSPLAKMRRVKVAKKLRQPFTQTEILALWQACRHSQMPIRDEALFLLLLDTGMRIGEACALTLNDIRFDQRLVVVGGEGKARRERLIPIGQKDRRDGGRMVRALRRWVNDRQDRGRGNNRVFIGRDGYPLESQGGSEAIARLGKVAGVDDAGPHRIRHTFATAYLCMYPGDEIGLRRIMGHVSNEVLADYVHFAHATIAERVGRVSLSETLVGPVALRPVLQAVAGLAKPADTRQVVAPRQRSSAAYDKVRELLASDPGLRERLLLDLLQSARTERERSG